MAGTNSMCQFYRDVCLIESQIKGVKNDSKCPFYRGVSLIESQIKGVKKGRDQLQVSVLQRCPSYRGAR